MPTYTVHDYSDTCAALTRAIQDLNVRIKVSENNMQLRESYDSQLAKLEENISYCNGILDIMKPMLADIQEYIDKRRKASMQNINNALRIAGEVIPDSTDGIFFQLDGDEAWLSTPDGLIVDMVEGGGYRQISSTFIRSVVVAANDSNLKTLMLDEIFSTVSPENSAALSLYLNIMCQDMQVISIEQKPQVYSNIDCTAYKFTKVGEYSEYTKTEVKRGSNILQEISNTTEGTENGIQVDGVV